MGHIAKFRVLNPRLVDINQGFALPIAKTG